MLRLSGLNTWRNPIKVSKLLRFWGWMQGSGLESTQRSLTCEFPCLWNLPPTTWSASLFLSLLLALCAQGPVYEPTIYVIYLKFLKYMKFLFHFKSISFDCRFYSYDCFWFAFHSCLVFWLREWFLAMQFDPGSQILYTWFSKLLSST